MGVSVPDEESVKKKFYFLGSKKPKITFKNHKLVLNRRDLLFDEKKIF